MLYGPPKMLRRDIWETVFTYAKDVTLPAFTSLEKWKHVSVVQNGF